MASPWKCPIRTRCHGFWLQEVAFIHCSLNLYVLFASLIPHTASRSSSLFPHRLRQSKKYARQRRSLYFSAALPWGRHLLAFTVAGTQEAESCLAGTLPPHTSMPRKTSHAMLRLHIYNTYSAATVNAWRRTVAH